MHEQRKVSQKAFRRREREAFWSPRVTKYGRLRKVTVVGEGAWYAVVDDIAEGTVVLQIANWPELDRGSHLLFDATYEQSYSLRALQRVVDLERTRHGQPAPDRPLRPGDAFLIQCNVPPGKNVVSSKLEGDILDITAAAREQAKIAMYGVVARKLSPAEAKQRPETSKEPDRFERTAGIRERLRPGGPKATARPEI